MSSSLQDPAIGYTLGDQAGIGPEVIAAALASLSNAPVRLVPMGPAIPCTPGIPTEATARAAWDQLETAADALRSGAIDAVVTAPICKQALQHLGFPFPGQTEFFASRLGVSRFSMCLTGEHLTVALCTTHLALEEVAQALTKEQIVSVTELLCDFLRGQGTPCPRIAIAGLNPHNGENGAFGVQEQTIIIPALELLQKTLADRAIITGPCVPDTVYRDAASGLYDGIVAPYHDQALIPLKLLDFDNAVNATLGLPRLRVSPDHGTAFSIAGRGIASPTSTIRAFHLAIRSIQTGNQ